MADIFFPPPLSGALRRTTQEWAKLPMAKEKPGVKIEKKYNMCWEARQRIDGQSSKLPFEAIANVFISRLVLA